MKLTKTLKLALKSMLLDVKMGEIVAKENTLIYDGEAYEVGTEVFVKDTENEGEVIVAPDGEYTIIEGDAEVKIVVVREGKIAEIKEIETETEETPETETEVEIEAEVIETEIKEVDPADETETEEVEEKNEDEIAEIKTKIEELTKGVAEMMNAIAALTGRIDVLDEKMAKVEAPAADPAETEVETKMSKLRYLRKN